MVMIYVKSKVYLNGFCEQYLKLYWCLGEFFGGKWRLGKFWLYFFLFCKCDLEKLWFLVFCFLL